MERTCTGYDIAQVDQWKIKRKWHKCVFCAKSIVVSDANIIRLPCLHIICGGPICLEKLDNFCQQHGHTNEHRHCPICGDEYRTEDICSANKELEIIRHIKSKCDCGKYAMFHCMTCKVLYCNTCYDHHQKVAYLAKDESYKLGDKRPKCSRNNCKNFNVNFVDREGLAVCDICKSEEDIDWNVNAAQLKNRCESLIANFTLIKTKAKTVSDNLKDQSMRSLQILNTWMASLNENDTFISPLKEVLENGKKTLERYNMKRWRAFGFASRSFQFIGFLKDLITPYCQTELVMNFRMYEPMAEKIKSEWCSFFSELDPILRDPNNDRSDDLTESDDLSEVLNGEEAGQNNGIDYVPDVPAESPEDIAKNLTVNRPPYMFERVPVIVKAESISGRKRKAFNIPIVENKVRKVNKVPPRTKKPEKNHDDCRSKATKVSSSCQKKIRISKKQNISDADIERVKLSEEKHYLKLDQLTEYLQLFANEKGEEGCCGICHDGGELTCCETCEKVFETTCHIPRVKNADDPWSCFFCVDKTKVITDDFCQNAKKIYEIPSGLYGANLKSFLIMCKFLNELYKIHESLVVRYHLVAAYERVNYKAPPLNLNSIRDKLLESGYTSFRQFAGDIKKLCSVAKHLYKDTGAYSKEYGYFQVFVKECYQKLAQYKIFESARNLEN